MKVEERNDPMGDLLQAFGLLARRGTGAEPWASPFRDHPIAFLLDSVGDSTSIWSPTGELLYQNRAAMDLGIARGTETAMEELSTGGRRFERRTLRCGSDGVEYIIEIIREIGPAESPRAEP